MVYWQLFLAFARANLLGYGGGPAIIPLLKAEVVDTYSWVSPDDFADSVAIGNTLPGPIATKMASYIGYKVAGPFGSLMALAGTVVPTAVIMVLLAAILFRFKDAPMIKGVIKAVKPVVFVLFVMLAIDFLSFARPDKAGWLPALIAVGSFVALYFFQVREWQAILAAIVVGAFFVR